MFFRLLVCQILVDLIKSVAHESHAKAIPSNYLGKVHRLRQQQSCEELQSNDGNC